ncbi:MaoC family dehydratase [Paraburkholderia sp. J11-2]|uniref:MaoC family dehydratase n=1 Tax=Paraburkholderia sp. J11-2 TaxID=2805431 RepID=UPI002AB76DD0|nr:MaoC family dehydratase [Paraburkholderia sp. J11-2]
MIKNRSGHFFEDFRVGVKLCHATPRTLTEGDRSLYIGLTGSRAVLCTATTNARHLGFDVRPLEDLLVFNTAFGKTVPDISLNAVANLGYADVRFLAPVYPGDTLAVETEVIGLKENTSRRSGIVYVRSTAKNQFGEAVLTWIRWVMIHKRDAQADCAQTVVPPLPASVEPARLPRHPFGPEVAKVTALTGVSDLWDDYVVGERIDHPGAMAVNDSDHSIATRLYQNTAKAHFDARAASANEGRRLVYGGHVMSLCKALTYDGLENALTMLAINAGSHVNPTFAGDTLVCSTLVTGKFDFGDEHVGALRLRTIGAKNVDTAATVFPDADAGRPAHSSDVVLDLDYTIAMPKKSATWSQ